jgi:antitoxin FitA
MTTMIQIRNVPDDLHRTLKLRAVREGKSLSALLLEMARREAERPSIDEWIARVRENRFDLGESGAEAVRALRDESG